MLTGLAPRTHGLNGWFVRDRRFGGVVAPLPLNDRVGHRLRPDRATLKHFFPYPNLFEQRRRASVALLPAYIADSPFSRRHCRGAQILPHIDLEHLVDSVVAASRALRRKGGGFVHAYYAEFDAVSHEFGCNSAEAVAEFWRVESAYRRLVSELSGDNVTVVTAPAPKRPLPPGWRLSSQALPGWSKRRDCSRQGCSAADQTTLCCVSASVAT
nr:alkaline phosphatase family protein [Azoarcus taiwanensis]